MAQGNPNRSAQLWAEAAAKAKYAIHNGLPLIGVSGDTGDGHIVPVPAPSWFAAIEDEGQRYNVAKALIAHALRVGQSKVKAEKNPTRDHATSGAASVIDGTYTPQRESDNDILDSEAMRQFEAMVRGKVLAAKADASDADIAATVEAQLGTDAGKRWVLEAKARIANAGTYSVSRKGEKGKPTAVAISLGE